MEKVKTLAASLEHLRGLQAESEQEAQARSARVRAQAKERLQELPFPVDVFPPACQEFINAYCWAFGCRADHYGLAILTVGGAAIGNSLWVEERGALHPPLIYAVICDKPNAGKSPIIDTVIRPFWALEEKFDHEYRAKLAEVKDEDGNVAGELPPRREILLGNFTLESVYGVIAGNPRGVMIYRDEIIGFLRAMGKYTKTGGSDEEAFYLEAWNGKGFKLNRKKEGVAFVKRCCLSILGGTQPSVLLSFTEGNRADNGFLARFLFSYPDNTEKPAHMARRPDVAHSERWRTIIQRIYALPIGEGLEDAPRAVPLAEKAQRAYADFFNRNATDINNADDEVVQAILGKFDSYVLRLALVLELLAWAETGPDTPDVFDRDGITIGEKAMAGAIRLIAYFRQTALKVVNRVSSPAEALPHNQKVWYFNLPDEFQRKEAVELGDQAQVSEATIGRLLCRKDLFKKYRQGWYNRLY